MQLTFVTCTKFMNSPNYTLPKAVLQPDPCNHKIVRKGTLHDVFEAVAQVQLRLTRERQAWLAMALALIG